MSLAKINQYKFSHMQFKKWKHVDDDFKKLHQMICIKIKYTGTDMFMIFTDHNKNLLKILNLFLTCF